uniref:Uncharacterized protein LOC100372677 isoform X1 n=1 Tax=Saccoglossus kowalevskii TaxID=10224 RepID=A0ABM0MH40_SACKO|nr:PREDICTED: uncharacterized protein LOC100372677 isoform X1 [Saccoglossus kowalevskii]XP_006819331.1 PREDICTED: uncharacterized protein LOC100372677 isoform X2 [Saccoglossus kowalevskii]
MSVLNYTFNATNNGEALKCQGFQHEDLTVRSARVYMNVKHIPIISGIGVISWSDGGVINVECVDTANPDSYQYEWEAEGGQFGTTSENTWELTDTGDDGKEEITCTATNDMGSSTSYTQIVTIPYEPTVNAITDSPLKIEAGSDAVLECGTDAVPPFPDNESWEWLQQDGSNYIQIDPSDEGYDIDPVEGDEQKTTLTVFDAQGVQTYRCQLGESYADIEVQATGSAAQTGASSCDTGCIIGISVGVAVFVFVIIIIVLWFCMSRRKKKNSSEKYTSSNSNHNRQPTQPAPSDVEMTPGLTSVPPPNDDMDGPRYSNGNKYDYDDRYDNRYEDMPPHRYDDPPDNYNRYDEPPIDEGDGYPNSPTEPTYAGPYSRSPGRQAEPQLQYADLDLRGPTSQSTPNYPQPPRTEYATITPTIV